MCNGEYVKLFLPSANNLLNLVLYWAVLISVVVIGHIDISLQKTKAFGDLMELWGRKWYYSQRSFPFSFYSWPQRRCVRAIEQDLHRGHKHRIRLSVQQELSSSLVCASYTTIPIRSLHWESPVFVYVRNWKTYRASVFCIILLYSYCTKFHSSHFVCG